MKYSELSLGRYMKIKSVLTDGSTWIEQQPRLIAIVNNLTEDEVLNLKLDKYQALTSTIEFLSEPPIPSKCPKKVVLNGKPYYVERTAKELSAAQFLDYQGYLDSGNIDKVLPNILSIFIIPEGKNYGEYDIMESIEDINNHLSVSTALGIFNFFQRAFLKSVRHMLRYLETLMMILKRKEKTETIRTQIQTAQTQIAHLQDLLRNGDFLYS